MRYEPQGEREFNCRITSRVSSRHLKFADVTIHHIGSPPKRSLNGRPYLRVFYTGESNQTNQLTNNEANQRLFGIIVSFHLHRQYHFTWTHRQQPHFMSILHGNRNNEDATSGATWSAWKQRQSAVAAFGSSCRANRQKVFSRLSKNYSVHNYGACGDSHPLPSECAAVVGRYPQKLCVFRKYKYAVAFENTKEVDYVTEKVYHALLSGTVPLYWGIPNIDDFVPMGRSSFVDVEPFIPGMLGDLSTVSETSGEEEEEEEGFRRLGQYLKQLEFDEVAVRHLFAWRSVTHAEEWGERFLNNMYHTDPVCAICAETRKKRGIVLRHK
ncbi:Alpha-(1,3)-fucosyltransferase, family GT10 [Trypanosoma grayi]|uniref:Alpha-(1,3)-fucosyltransferase, family GT10 n=1 Tax=Trypanosoma grayi TaxID=71804 RepID=UPI0004F4BB3B|nr:Alpha-(1,3)-fucosyltransferase, family GT10 [Trypanosoma grayi]KEG10654.1 Alpha-(1,3)-fucosyltransferase, family GT10 [Trypanosoma grayi]